MKNLLQVISTRKQQKEVGRTSLKVLIFLEGEEAKVKPEGWQIPNDLWLNPGKQHCVARTESLLVPAWQWKYHYHPWPIKKKKKKSH